MMGHIPNLDDMPIKNLKRKTKAANTGNKYFGFRFPILLIW